MTSALFRSVAMLGAALGCAGSAMAGGYVAPVIEGPVVAAPVAQAAQPSWAGAYVGGSLGYGFSAKDEVGLASLRNGQQIGRATDLTEIDISGVTIAAQAGYRWQRNRLVFGPELLIEGGSVEDEGSFTLGGLDGTLEDRLNYLVALTFRTGYLIDDQTMIYGLGGFAHGDFDYALKGDGGSVKENLSTNGFIVGLGAERRINERLSVFGEYTYRDLDRTDVRFDLGGGSAFQTVASPSHSAVRVGMNYSF